MDLRFRREGARFCRSLVGKNLMEVAEWIGITRCLINDRFIYKTRIFLGMVGNFAIISYLYSIELRHLYYNVRDIVIMQFNSCVINM